MTLSLSHCTSTITEDCTLFRVSLTRPRLTAPCPHTFTMPLRSWRGSENIKLKQIIKLKCIF